MARSRKAPVITDQQNGCTKEAKRRATRAVRKSKDIANGKAYKKEYSSYDINDFSFFCPNNPKAYRK